MQRFRKTVFLIIPVFIFTSLFSATSFAGGKKVGKHKGNDAYSQGQKYDCNLPPGLNKQGKVPPGWAKKCWPQGVKYNGEKYREYYPDHNHKRSSGSYDKPIIEGDVDIGVDIHIPLR